jgi:hypothetical protein
MRASAAALPTGKLRRANIPQPGWIICPLHQVSGRRLIAPRPLIGKADMRGIFISYRRDDAEGQAGRLFDELSAHFGRDAVFMDVAGIKKGMDFRRIIDEHVTSCGVLLVIIGKTWLSATDGKGQRRLDDANDFVRLETAVALARDIPVVPVLVHDAVMPTAQELPDVLKELAFRNGTELTHARWDSDVKLRGPPAVS